MAALVVRSGHPGDRPFRKDDAVRTARRVHFVALAVILSLGCDTQQFAGNAEGPGRRPQQLALAPEQELRLGREAYREILSHPEKYGRTLPADRPEVQRARGITRHIVEAAGIEPLQREINLRLHGYRFEWEVNVLQNPQVNAFCLPAGKIVVFTGILPVAEDDDQMATVLSHEIAHALAHHASERLARSQSSDIRGKAYDRQQEAEADHIGVFLMTFAGYDPNEAVRFWVRMAQASAGRSRPPEFLSDHPSDAHRIQALRNWVPTALAANQAYKEGRIAPARR